MRGKECFRSGNYRWRERGERGGMVYWKDEREDAGGEKRGRDSFEHFRVGICGYWGGKVRGGCRSRQGPGPMALKPWHILLTCTSQV